MLEELKKAAMEQAMKVLSHPAVGKLLSDQRLLNVISRGFEIHGQLKKAVEEKMLQMARQMQLASQKELEQLNENLDQLKDKVEELEKKLRAARKAGAKS